MKWGRSLIDEHNAASMQDSTVTSFNVHGHWDLRARVVVGHFGGELSSHIITAVALALLVGTLIVLLFS